MSRATAAGLPDIAVSADVGRFLKMLAGLAAPGGAKLAIELGTLAGYSGIWLARGMARGGRLITVEPVARESRDDGDTTGAGSGRYGPAMVSAHARPTWSGSLKPQSGTRTSAAL